MHYVTRIYFGRSIPAGFTGPHVANGQSFVDDRAFDAFVDDTVSVAFPAGFSITHGVGGWRDASTGEHVRETSAVLEVYHSGSIRDRDAVRNVAVTYRQRFGQDAVMVATQNLSEGVQFL